MQAGQDRLTAALTRDIAPNNWPSFRFDVKSISHTRTGYHSQFLQTGQVMFIFIAASSA
jgi:hypothetical protein